MSKKMFTRLLLIFITVGALLGMSMGQAKASPHLIVTEVYWGGTNCIVIDSYNFNQLSYCGSPQIFREHDFEPGDNVGVNPYMGNADWMSCYVYFDGRLDYSDYAIAGDGTDVNCLREIADDGTPLNYAV